MQRRHHLLIPFLLLLLLTVSCEQTGGTTPDDEPSIVSFDPSPSTVSPGGEVTLSWNVNNATSLSISNDVDTEVVTVTGTTSTVVTPTETTTYTLTASDGSRSDTERTTVTVTGDISGGDDTAEPTGTFGVSLNPNGPFLTDDTDIEDVNDSRVIDVAPGGTFYAQVDYEDPSGITDIVISLVNMAPSDLAGPLPQGGFSIEGSPTGDDCDLTGNSEEVTCVYQIRVGGDVEPITALEGSGSEFAYVFRTQVTNGAGNTANDRGSSSRGYVNVTTDGGGDNSNPPTNQDPVANAGADQTNAVVGTEVSLNGEASTDPDTNDTLSYAWAFTSQPSGSSATLSSETTATPSFTPDVAGDYIAQLTVSDGNGGSSTDSVTVTAAASAGAIIETVEAADINATEDGDYVEISGSFVVIDPAYILEESTYPEDVEPEITLTGTPTDGTALYEDGEIFYEADEGYSGPDSFDYILSVTIAGEEVSDTGTITVNVE